MEIRIIHEDKKQFIDLLLLADEQESMIDKYLERGELFALYDNGLKSICVVTIESPDICELKNIATHEKWHGMGYASKLIRYISTFYKDKYKPCLSEQAILLQPYSFIKKTGSSFPIEFLISLQTTTTTLYLKMGYSL